MQTAKEYEVRNAGQVVGPISLDQIRRGLEAGKIPQGSEARPVGSTDWLPVGTVVENAFQVTPTAPVVVKKRYRWHVSAACTLVVLVGSTPLIWRLTEAKHAAFPIEAKHLPSNTTSLVQQEISGAHEKNENLRQLLLAGFVASNICKPSVANPVTGLLELEGNPRNAGKYFKQAHLDDVRTMMTCGRELAPMLQSQDSAEMQFTDDTGKHVFRIFNLKMDQLPTKLGWIHYSFSGLPGFCYVPQAGEAATEKDCVDDSYASVHEGTRWIFGNKASIMTVARSFAQPKDHISTTIEVLQEAANAMSGLTWRAAEATPKSSKAVLTSPCVWAADRVAGSKSDFMTACFPITADKQIEVIDGKLRAASDEIDTDIEKAGAIRGQMALVARDSEAASAMQKDVNEFVRDWQSHIENNETKLVKLATEKTATPDQRIWAGTIDTFIKALKGMDVSRSGRVVTISFNQKLSSDDIKEVREAVENPNDKRQVASMIIDAIEKTQPVPETALAQLIGPKLAAFVLLPPPVASATETPTNPEPVAREDPRAKIAAARQKVRANSFGVTGTDGNCQAEGKPPFRRTYEGGTDDENELVALADNCVHRFGSTSRTLANIYCCPK